MEDIVELRFQQHISHQIYRQQLLNQLPDPYPSMLPVPLPIHHHHQLNSHLQHHHHHHQHQQQHSQHHQLQMPPQRYGLPGVEAKLQNTDLWSPFHQIGTEMIITKSGRRMFPSLRLSVSGLEDDVSYCVLLEMVPRGDCRYKFSGSQWVPAGGSEPQSTQRMYLHPDSPALGSHWSTQPILFNKVKLTNNTLDNCGHIVLTSMHKYQPRLHIIRTADPAQIPWAPQQPFSFPETEYVAVTAYQNDRITKLKIDNNPFAKGFRETGQSRCKRKMIQLSSSSSSSSTSPSSTSSLSSLSSSSSSSSLRSKPLSSLINNNNNISKIYDNDQHIIEEKRARSSSFSESISSQDDSGLSISECSSSGTSSPIISVVDDNVKRQRNDDGSQIIGCGSDDEFENESEHSNNNNNNNNRSSVEILSKEQQYYQEKLQNQQQELLQHEQQQQQQHLHHNQMHHQDEKLYAIHHQHDLMRQQFRYNPTLIDLAYSYFASEQHQHHQNSLRLFSSLDNPYTNSNNSGISYQPQHFITPPVPSSLLNGLMENTIPNSEQQHNEKLLQINNNENSNSSLVSDEFPLSKSTINLQNNNIKSKNGFVEKNQLKIGQKISNFSISAILGCDR